VDRQTRRSVALVAGFVEAEEFFFDLPVYVAAGEFGRPLVAPPGMPADRLKILRDAFDKSVHDPALLAAAEKRRLEMDPASGTEIEALAKEVIAATPDVVQKMQKLLGGEK